jgi:predicted ATP-binding protein involved in virulence
MRLKTLKIEQFRGFPRATELQFHDQFTLLVGENGVGKSSILWALRVLLSQIVHAGSKRTSDKIIFRVGDVTVGWPYLRAEAIVHSIPERFASKCTAQKNVASFVKTPTDDGKPRDHAVDTPDTYQFSHEAVGPPHGTRPNDVPPLAVYYSAHRSLARDLGLSKVRAAGGMLAARSDALEDRELRLEEQAALWHKEQALEESDNVPAHANRAILKVMPTFLGDFENLRTEVHDREPRLVVDKSDKRLELHQLSDGERGILTLLLDLTRRLSQANPDLVHPAREGHAVVLIDELDLHLHPKWQRTIVGNLTKAFPKVQFIATTHSPQIIGEVQDDRIILLQKSGSPIRPAQTFGMDSNWILRHIMDARDRDPEVAAAMEAILVAIREAKLSKARQLVAELRSRIGEIPELAGAEAKIERARQALEDAPRKGTPIRWTPGDSKKRKRK